MERVGFCDGWEFSRDGGEFASVAVPHDAMLGNRRDANAPAGSASGYFYGGSYAYRKHFQLSAEQASGVVLIEFEGVYRNTRIRVNGTDISAPPYGFVPFFADVSEAVHVGDNCIELEADNAGQPDCRWYSGGGIHRPVWLWTGGPCRIMPEGVRVTTLETGPANIRVDVEHTAGTPRITIVDDGGSLMAVGEGDSVTFSLEHAHLWSSEHPYLYRCVVELYDGDVVADTASCRFGIRTLAWSPEGLFVNGRETLLRGGCIHSDNGILGAASFSESEYRRIRLLKQAGFNAVRVAHNPAATALLDACDEIGMYVMDETWDVWYTPKSAHDYAGDFLDWCDYDLRRLASRDYNHPSVVMYSIGNEVADPIASVGVDLERSLVELLHSLDPTRPVTCGLNLTMMVMEKAGHGWYTEEGGVAESATKSGAPRGSMLFNMAAQMAGTGMTMLSRAPGADALVSPALDALDIAGYNYASARYAVDARRHPERIVVGTETFPHELARNWKLCTRLPNVVGDFMWAAWDYLGEAGAGAWAYTPEEAGFSKPWPWLLAGSGALDILGQPGAPAALAGAVWKTAHAPSIQVRPVNCMGGRTYKATWRGSDAVPSWSWHGCKGGVAHVEVYDGRAYAIRLELNGRFVAEARVKDCMAHFKLAYEPGTLTATAVDKDGHELAQGSLVSASEPFHIDVQPEKHHVPAGGIAYVAVAIVGANGEVESNVDERLQVTVEDGELLGFGSAQPATTESYLDGAFTSYRGRALAVVRRSESGVARVAVTGSTLPTAEAFVEFV